MEKERKITKREQRGNFIAEFYLEDGVPFLELRSVDLSWQLRVTADTPLYVLFSELEWSEDVANLPELVLINTYMCSQTWEAAFQMDVLKAAGEYSKRLEEKEIEDRDDEMALTAVRAKDMAEKLP